MRDIIKAAKRVVIKIGSRVLLEDDGRPNYAQIAHLVGQIARLKQEKREIVFVTSGAIGAGLEALSIKKRPSDLPTLQAAAAIGQVRLMRSYEDLFAGFGIVVAQVLLTHDDLRDRERHLNVKHTLEELLKRGVIPIINENDCVATEEINFGDNDVLGSLVAMLIEAKVLVLLTTSEGFLIKDDSGKIEVLPHIYEINEAILSHIEKHKVGLSKGGMKSKLAAATNMVHVGGMAIIASGRTHDALEQIFSGQVVGTMVKPNNLRAMPGRKRWIAFYNKASGVITVDDGAKLAITNKGKSLLPVGVVSVSGDFDKGSVVEICDKTGLCFAKGIVQIEGAKLKQTLAKSRDLESPQSEIIHRDNLVILG